MVYALLIRFINKAVLFVLFIKVLFIISEIVIVLLLLFFIKNNNKATIQVIAAPKVAKVKCARPFISDVKVRWKRGKNSNPSACTCSH